MLKMKGRKNRVETKTQRTMATLMKISNRLSSNNQLSKNLHGDVNANRSPLQVTAPHPNHLPNQNPFD